MSTKINTFLVRLFLELWTHCNLILDGHYKDIVEKWSSGRCQGSRATDAIAHSFTPGKCRHRYVAVATWRQSWHNNEGHVYRVTHRRQGRPGRGKALIKETIEPHTHHASHWGSLASAQRVLYLTFNQTDLNRLKVHMYLATNSTSFDFECVFNYINTTCGF